MSSPTRFWSTSGTGQSDYSELESVDFAFLDSGLGYQNHVTVSSIPPTEEIFPTIDKKQGVTYIPLDNELRMLPVSNILYVVRSIRNGLKGETIASCISLAKVTFEINDVSNSCMLAYETSGVDLEIVKNEALVGVRNMAEEREAKLDVSWRDSGFKTITSSLEVSKKFGCSASFVVFDPFTFKR